MNSYSKIHIFSFQSDGEISDLEGEDVAVEYEQDALNNHYSELCYESESEEECNDHEVSSNPCMDAFHCVLDPKY